ncbi:CaiB/BaiF CoA transferase family protein [Streptomyces sp. NPDC055006]
MGALTGVKVIEFAGMGPGPFAAMLLSDMGADVIRVDRPDPVVSTLSQSRSQEPMLRGRRSIGVDLRNPEGLELVLRLVDQAGVVIEGFRPGVVERLGIGPDTCLERNPALVYGRMTGWGQEGPLAHTAGHDLNYIALSGALHGIGPAGGAPVPPLVLAGDMGGGGVYLALGICAALVESGTSGRGQVVDAAIVDGSASLMSAVYGARAAGVWVDERGSNRLDGGAPFYRTYRCADDRYLAVGAVEDQFFAMLLERLGLDPGDFAGRSERANWHRHAELLGNAFLQRTRDEWTAVFDGSDACVTPVLDMAEAQRHPHNLRRGLFQDMSGTPVPAPAPRFGRTPSRIGQIPVVPGTDTLAVLREAGYSEEEIVLLCDSGAVRTADAR